MKWVRLFQIVITGLLIALLTACGGGSNDDGDASVGSGNPTAPSGSTSNSSIGLVSATRSSLPTYVTTNNPVADMTGWLNTVRRTLGLKAILVNASLQQAAQNHSNYEVINQVGGHTETSGRRGFTGATPEARISAVYPSANYYSEVTAYYFRSTLLDQPTGVSAVQQLIDAPFHRVSMFSDALVMGAGYSTDWSTNSSVAHSAFTIDFANTANAFSPNQLVAYPYAGQTNVPISWVANESPNPFDNLTSYVGATVGYPVTIQGEVSDRLVVSSFTIATANGTDVPCHEVDPSTPSLGSDLLGAAMCVPFQPYTPNTQYTATVSGSKNGRSFTVSWSWTTGKQ